MVKLSSIMFMIMALAIVYLVGVILFQDNAPITENVIFDDANEESPVLENFPEDTVQLSESNLPEDPIQLSESNLVLVTRIIDGDTIEIEGGERVRLICIDTPERGEEGSEGATNFLKLQILNKEVRLENDVSETDRYGRLLKYVYIDDTFINEEIVRNGYGKAYRYAPDTSLCSVIEKAEASAKAEGIGIWAEKTSPDFGGSSCGGNFYNCGDFSSCSEVMAVFNACSYDVNQLDGDSDGIPCESLCA